MIYFSELKGKKVLTEDNVEIGKLEDIIFKASEVPSVTKFIIREISGGKLIIPVEFLKKINSVIIFQKSFASSGLAENELCLVKNLLDKQIIDLKGNKVVRVNDVLLQGKEQLYIAGVDISLLGIFRWLNLEKAFNNFLAFFHVNITSNFLSWGDIQPLELARGEVKLRKREDKLEKIQPADLADYLEKTNVGYARKFLRILDEKKAAEVIEKLNMNYQSSLFRHFKPEKAAKFLNIILSDDAVDILLALSLKKREEILNFVPSQKRNELERLLKLSTTPVGNLLITEFLPILPDVLVKDVIDKIKKETTDFSYLTPIYVTNKEKELIGVFNLHELLLQDFNTPVYKFMIQNLITIHLTTPVEIALNRMVRYGLQALPVIDENKHIIGVVTALSLIQLFVQKTL